MEFPITDLLSREECTQWIVEHFHPNEFDCKHCGAGVEQGRKFRTTHRSQLTDQENAADSTVTLTAVSCTATLLKLH